MQEIPLNRTTSLIDRMGRIRKIDVSLKRRFYPDHDTGELSPINCMPVDAKYFSGYKFEVLKHDFLLAFAPSEKRLPFLRITDPKKGGAWALWLKGYGENIPHDGIMPELCDKTKNGVLWKIDDSSEMSLDIFGHRIRKLIKLTRRPDWNELTFVIARGGGELIEGSSVGRPERLFMAFQKNAVLGENHPLFWFAAPHVWDSAIDGEGIENTNITVPTYELVPIHSGVWELKISLDADWLDNAKYPVFIDPTLELQPDAVEGYDTHISSNHGGNNYGALNYLYLVNTIDKYRTLIKFTGIDVIPEGSNIISAQLELHNKWYCHAGIYSTRKCYTEWMELEACWWTPKYGGSWSQYGGQEGVDYADAGDTQAIVCNDWTSWNVKNETQDWIDGNDNYGVFIVYSSGDGNRCAFHSSDDTTNRPKLIIEYDDESIFIPAKLNPLAGKGVVSPIVTGG